MTDNYYDYKPSTAAAAVFAALFGIVTIVIVAQCIWILIRANIKRVWTLAPFVVGGVLELLGYAIRIVSGKNPHNLGLYVLQSIFLLVSPALFAATIYMILGRVIYILDAGHHSLIPLKWLTKLFVGGDVASFLLQGAGGGLITNHESLGKAIVIVGLLVQVVFFGLFIIVMAVFQKRIRKGATAVAVETRNKPSSLRNWQFILVTLFFCSWLILSRSIVRLAEFAQGFHGYIISHEVYLYVFDAALMFLCMVIFALQDVPAFFYYVSQNVDIVKISGDESVVEAGKE